MSLRLGGSTPNVTFQDATVQSTAAGGHIKVTTCSRTASSDTAVISTPSSGVATYTPSTGMIYVVIECVGPGGSGGGCAAASNGMSSGGGGGGGAYSRKLVTAATVGASQTVTVGLGGAAPSAGNNAGNAGGSNTSVGSLCTAPPGQGGLGATANTAVAGGAGGVAGTGDISIPGQAGGTGIGGSPGQVYGTGGFGGSSFLGMGGSIVVQSANGRTGGKYGGGGGGGGDGSAGAGTNRAGGAGDDGFVIITEYCTV